MAQRSTSFLPDPVQKEQVKITTAKKYKFKSSSVDSLTHQAVRNWEAKIKQNIPILLAEFTPLLDDVAGLDRSTHYFQLNYTNHIQANANYQMAPSRYHEVLKKQAEARETVQAEYEAFLEELADLNEEAEDMHGALQAINDWELRMDGRTVVKFK